MLARQRSTDNQVANSGRWKVNQELPSGIAWHGARGPRCVGSKATDWTGQLPRSGAFHVVRIKNALASSLFLHFLRRTGVNFGGKCCICTRHASRRCRATATPPCTMTAVRARVGPIWGIRPWRSAVRALEPCLQRRMSWQNRLPEKRRSQRCRPGSSRALRLRTSLPTRLAEGLRR